MMQGKLFVLTVLVVTSLTAPVYAGEARDVMLQNMTGSVDYQKGGQGDWIKAAPNTTLAQSDVVRTGDSSTASLLFKGMSDATVEMRPNSVLELATVSEEKAGDDTELDIALGSVLVKAEKLKGESSF